MPALAAPAADTDFGNPLVDYETRNGGFREARGNSAKMIDSKNAGAVSPVFLIGKACASGSHLDERAQISILTE